MPIASNARVAIGRFRAATGNNPTQSITGVGFQPAAVIFFGNHLTTSPNEFSGVRGGFGLGWSTVEDADSDFFGQYTYATCTQTVLAGNRDNGNNKCYLQISANGLQVKLARLFSFDSDGFTLEYSGGQGVLECWVGYIAIGGTVPEGLQVYSRTLNTPAATGPQNVTGVGFQPDLLLFAHWGSGASAETGHAPQTHVGAADGNLNQWASCTTARYNFAPRPTHRYQRTDKCIVSLGMAALTGTVTHEASLTGVNADGFDLDWTTVDAGDIKPVDYIAIKGLGVKVGSFNSPGAVQTQDVTGLPWDPDAVIFSTVGAVASTSVQAHQRFCFGIGSRSERMAVALHTKDQSQTVFGQYYDEGCSIAVLENPDASTGTVKERAEIELNRFVVPNGFRVNWTSVESGEPREMLYIALRDSTTRPPIGPGTLGPLAWVEARWRTPDAGSP